MRNVFVWECRDLSQHYLDKTCLLNGRFWCRAWRNFFEILPAYFRPAFQLRKIVKGAALSSFAITLMRNA